MSPLTAYACSRDDAVAVEVDVVAAIVCRSSWGVEISAAAAADTG